MADLVLTTELIQDFDNMRKAQQKSNRTNRKVQRKNTVNRNKHQKLIRREHSKVNNGSRTLL